MKKTKTLIIVITAIVVILFGIFAYLVLGTDMFKSKKKMFNSLASQIDLNELMDTSLLENYMKRLSEDSSKNEGSIAVLFGDVINEKIDYTINNDPSNKKTSGNISYSQNGEEKITAKIIRNDSLYGLQCVFKQFLVLENRDLDKFAKKIGINNLSIPEKIETDSSKKETDEQTLKQIESILKKYCANMFDKIPEDRFTKVSKEKIEVSGKTISADGYRVVLNENDINDFLKNALEDIKEDQDVFNALNHIMNAAGSEELNWEEYKSIFASINTEDIKIETPIQLEVTMYKQGSKLVKAYAKLLFTEYSQDGLGEMYIDFAIYNNSIKLGFVSKFDSDKAANSDGNLQQLLERSNLELSIYINKINENGENGYSISLYSKNSDNNESSADIKITLKREDDQKYILKLDFTTSDPTNGLTVSFKNTTGFGDNTEIEKLDKDNMVIINDLSKEQLESILTTFLSEITRVVDINKTIIGNALINDGLIDNPETDPSKKYENKTTEDTADAVKNAASQAENQAKELFNSKFLVYEGVQGAGTVKTLLMEIKNSNQMDPKHSIACDFDESKLENGKGYMISFTKDSEGYINKVDIVVNY